MGSETVKEGGEEKVTRQAQNLNIRAQEGTSAQLPNSTDSEFQKYEALPKYPELLTKLGPAFRFLNSSLGVLLTP